MVKRYRKKPDVVQAVKWDGLNLSEIINFCGDAVIHNVYDAAYEVGMAPPHVDMYIRTLEGDMMISKGDYIIKGVQGEFYPCKSDIFEQTYEEVN